MNKTHKRVRADGILSAEELEKAIEEYKAKHAAAPEMPEATDGDEEETPVVSTPPADPEEKPEPVDVPVPEKKDADEPEEEKPIEEQFEEIKSEHTDVDEETQKLFDIIDTLLAEREFKSTNTDGNDEEVPVEETEEEKVPAEEEFSEDCGKNCDDADAEIPFTDEEEAEVEMDEDDDPIPTKVPEDLKPGEVMNADSVDRVIRARIQVGMIGKELNLDGLENMKLMAARKAVIKAVRPTMNLDGKSATYVNAAYAMACDEVKARNRKDTKYQKRQMFNADAKSRIKTGPSAEEHRQEMIERRLNRNAKEDK